MKPKSNTGGPVTGIRIYLTPAEQLELRQDIASGMTVRAAADKYNKSVSWVNRHKFDSIEKTPEVLPRVAPPTRDQEDNYIWNDRSEQMILRNVAAGIMPLNVPLHKNDPSALDVRYHQQESQSFAVRYEKALCNTADAMIMQCLSLLKEEPERVNFKTGSHIDPGWVSWAKTRIDTMLRVATYINPRRYGSKIDVASITSGSVEDASQIDPTLYSNDELKTLIALLQRNEAPVESETTDAGSDAE